MGLFKPGMLADLLINLTTYKPLKALHLIQLNHGVVSGFLTITKEYSRVYCTSAQLKDAPLYEPGLTQYGFTFFFVMDKFLLPYKTP